MGNANAMIEINSNIREVLTAHINQLQGLVGNEDKVMRGVAAAMTPQLRKRVHVDGKDSSGSPIGTYSPGYMKVRTGNYANSGKKDAGTNKAGVARPKYNRTADTKVILSLTSQMEQDLAICEKTPIKTSNGYGIGYINAENYRKALWCELTYKKPILTQLTTGEKETAIEIAISETDKFLNTN